MTTFTAKLKFFLLSVAFLLLAELAHGQNKAVITGMLYLRTSRSGATVEKKSSSYNKRDRFVHIGEDRIWVDDDGRSFYRYRSELRKNETSQASIAWWDAQDESGVSCKVGLLGDKENNTLVFFVDYQQAGGGNISYNYYLEPE